MIRKCRCLPLVLLMGGLLICPVFAASSFPDVTGYEEFTEAVSYVSEAGIMVGDNNGNFNPYKTVTRAEMATIVCRMLNEDRDLETSTQFTDVPVGHWANKYISKAASLSIVNGYGGGKFGPSDSVTYEQAVTMIIRAIGGNEVAIEDGGYPDGYILVAEENALLDRINAKKSEPLSRSDIAQILYNYHILSSSVD